MFSNDVSQDMGHANLIKELGFHAQLSEHTKNKTKNKIKRDLAINFELKSGS